ncbi:unnamed protein product [Choristocarpus tenellus]
MQLVTVTCCIQIFTTIHSSSCPVDINSLQPCGHGCQMPDPASYLEYRELLGRYRLLYPSLKPIFQPRASLAKNSRFQEKSVKAASEEGSIVVDSVMGEALVSGGIMNTEACEQGEEGQVARCLGGGMPLGIVNASILAADMADLAGEVSRVVEAGADWIHIDVVDNRFAKVLTLGPAVVASLHRHHPMCFLDVHLAVENPGEYVNDLGEAGASQVLFHMEALTGGLNEAVQLATKIRAAGMRVGVALKPQTPASAILPLLHPRQLLHCVDVLAVQPGFGGQRFDESVLSKVQELRSMCPVLDIQVDGGVNASTVSACVSAGANILTAGSFLFGRGGADLVEGAATMRAALDQKWMKN